MTRFVLFISCFFLIGMVVECKEGYLLGSDGCKMNCLTRPGDYCELECSLVGGENGYCASWLTCYCYNVPDSVTLWESDTNECGKRK
uniref:Putative sodium channel toxin n=1 Tax=Tityus obscurus TaxID=1221240 RepID=A0A1E1WVT2_TITOB